MKRIKKNSGMAVRCAERDRLWAAFIAVGAEWGVMQEKMRKTLAKGGVFDPNISKVTDIKNRIEKTHSLFSRHIENHGCGEPSISVLKGKKKIKRSGKK